MSAKNSKESNINSKRDVMESVSRRSSISSVKSMVKMASYDISIKYLFRA